MTCGILLILWQIAAIAVHNDILIPTPMQTFEYLVQMLGTQKFYTSVAATVWRVGCGLVLSMALALVLSIFCSLSHVFRRLFEPVQILTRTIPNVSYIIIALIWLGSEGAVMLVSFLILFPIFMNGFLNRLDSESGECADASAVYPETAYITVTKKILPELLDEIVATGRTAASMGFKVGVMAEILGSVQSGIGRQINYCRLDLNTAGIVAWTIVLIAISAVIDTLFGKINRK